MAETDDKGNLNNDSFNERKRILEDIRDIEQESSRNLASIFNFGKNYNKILQNQRSLRKDINIYQDALNSGELEGKKLSSEALTLLAKKKLEYEKIVKSSETTLKSLNKTKIVLNGMANEAASFGNNLNVIDYLAESDKAIKGMNTSLGISGALAETFKNNIVAAASASARLGGSIQDLTDIQAEYTNSTDKLSALSQTSLERTVAMSKAIGMSASDTGELVGNFNTIGLSAQQTASFVEATLNSSESMGINGSKTVKLMKDNFDKINKYRFQGGVEAFKNMVQFSQKTKQNLEGVFNAAENFRTLEGAITANAELSTLGGNMAKQDAFQMGFLARNDPQKFAEKLNEMTKGIYSFNKSTGSFQASSVDLDRLRRMAEITGQSFEELSKEARKSAEVEFISSKTFALSPDDKALVSQLAEFDQKSKTFKVTIDGKSLDIASLTSNQLNILKQGQKSLEARTLANTAFDEQFKNAVMELKTALLPLLDGINWLLKKVNGLGDSWGANLAKIGTIGIGLMALKGISSNLGTLAVQLVKLPFSKMGGLVGGAGKAGGGIASSVLGGAGSAGGAAQSLGGGLSSIPPGPALMSKAAGIAAIGVAAAGIGAGIYLAAKGVSSVADSFAKLNPEQINGVLKAMGVIGVTMLAIGVAGSFAGPGLIAVGAGVTLIGAGIFLAATGMANLVTSFQGIKDPALGTNIMNLGLGIGSVAASTALLGNPLSLIGFAALGSFLSVLQGSIDFSAMSTAFQSASAFMSAPSANLDKLRETIDVLNNADTSALSAMKDMLTEFTSKPLQVEFKDKNVAINIDLTNNIDGEAIGKKLQIGRRATLDVVNARRGT